MTDFTSLAAVVGGLYLSECCWWVPRGSLIFRSLGFRRFAAAYPSPGLGNDVGGFVLLNPLPPLGTAFQCERWPISVTADGVISFVAQTTDPMGRPPQPVVFIPFSKVNSASQEGRTVFVESEPFCRVGSEASAIRWAKLVTEWSRLPLSQRSAAIKQSMMEAFDSVEVQSRVRQCRDVCKSLRVWCHCLMVLWLVGLPVIIGIHSLRHFFVPWVSLLIGTLLIVAQQFNIAHRKLLPKARSHRRRSLLMMALNPGVAIRACDAISRHLLVEFQPLAVAIAVCPPDEARRFARSVLADIRHPLEFVLSGKEIERQVEMEFTQQLAVAAERLLANAGFDLESLLAPSQREDPSCKTYCPRCDRQYCCDASSCASCAIPLKEWPHATNDTAV